MRKAFSLALSPFLVLSCTFSPPYVPPVMKLPDPFLFADGTTRMTLKSEWAARRAEIAAQAQAEEFGLKPDAPPIVTGAFNAGAKTLTVTCSDGGSKTISFTCAIAYPPSGGPTFPAMIAIGGSGLSTLCLSLNAAVITFPNDLIAQQVNASSRGTGKFYDYYGADHSAGALMAWAWGVSRLIDALETTPAAGIDPDRLGVTGCSRNGKGALVAGAYDERIKLTVPQESGSGGAASWRVSQFQLASFQNVQTLGQIVTENCWFRSSFSQYGGAVDTLPFDHHEIEALCAPRALLVIENTSMEWLGNLSTFVTANAAHMVWNALGAPDAMGFSQIGHGDHCVMPASQQPEVTAYVGKFLVGDGAAENTNVMRSDGGFTFDAETWTDWTEPVLY